MNIDNESTANSVAEHDNKAQSDFLNMFANYSIFMDMVKRTAIDTAEAIVKRELRNFFSGFLEGLDCDDCYVSDEDTEDLKDLEELKRL